ncbi:MAG TPA: DUF692 domain-containing protein [Myxococcota bacterium]|nr:DUF692 domain-containing protein [Myxococcota bacterium]
MSAPGFARPDDVPFLGVGVGLRTTHYPRILETPDPVRLGIDFFEAISENYMVPGGRPPRVLDEVRTHSPVVLHGVSLNVGSADPLDAAYLAELAALIDRYEPAWVSDHLCWTGVGGHNLHDLLPLPYTEAALAHAAERVRRVQDRLGRRVALENVSSYFAYSADAMPEWEFLVRIAEQADCGILLDVNNVFVSAHNHGFDPERYLAAIPSERVFQIHLAGHSESGPLLIDTHDHPVCNEVWAHYETTLRRLGPVSTLIEWDEEIPELEVLAAEAARAREILARVAGMEKWHGTSGAASPGCDPGAALAPHHGT